MFTPASRGRASVDTVTLGVGLAICASLLFAGQDSISKHLADNYAPEFFLAIRFWAFAGFALVFAAWRAPGGIRGALKAPRSIGLQMARGVLIITEIWIFTYALTYIQLADLMAIFSSSPLLTTALAAIFLGEQVGWRRWLAVGAAVLGVAIILQPGAGIFGFGALLGLLSAFLYSCYTLLTRMTGRTDSIESSLLYFALVGAVAMTPAGLSVWGDQNVAPMDWFWIFVLCCTGIGAHWALTKALSWAPASTLQPFSYIGVAGSILVAVAVLGERLEATTLLGVTLIVAAGLYALHRERIRAREARAAALAAGEAGRPV
ncbi:DMT family transporter [Neomegalonema sp.]|uniref:DMT family transporter n=1 Tax=Neomegalonema sp. TaxID=2039713 RepID=UPI002625C650|nr:DMT family transporter [Neomegalonema sp.]MDD2868069.1 DMT family transporter [Neomegalonema sp.]